MAYRDPERKRENDRRYREANKARIAATKKAWVEKNAEAVKAKKNAYYVAHVDERRDYQREYRARYNAAHEISLSSLRYQQRKARNPEAVRKYGREQAAKTYAADPVRAAIKRAKNCLVESTGIPMRLLPEDMVEAKAVHLLLRRATKAGRK